MIVDIDLYVDFLIKTGMTERQFLLCYLLYTDAEKELADGRRLYQPSNNSKLKIINLYKLDNFSQATKKEHYFKESDVIWLKENGFIEILGTKLTPDLLKLTPKFLDEIVATTSHFDEFWYEYPDFVDNFNRHDTRKIKLKSTDKDALEAVYRKKVASKILHKKIIEVLKYAKENKMINCSIDKYVASQQWEVDEKLMREETKIEKYGLKQG